MRSVRLVANYFESPAEPASPLYSDYLAYKSSRITHKEWIARLPHIAMISDSVCTDVYISTAWSTFRRARKSGGKNWFLDVDPGPGSIQSVSKRLEKLTPFVAIECGGVGAMVDDQSERQSLFRRILGTRNFSGQVTQLLRLDRFPDLILISIGHNNVDWTWRCPPQGLEQPQERLQLQSEQFREKFSRQLRRLIEHAQSQHHRVAIVVFGLINFESYFKAREAAERVRAADSSLYPHLETTYKYFNSFRPAYRRNLIRLAQMANNQLGAMVTELGLETATNANVQVRYSDALAKADLSRVELVHAIDGWHPSVEGHNVLAEAAFSALGPSLEFLGIR